jgi:hypothetical protein
VVLSGGKLLVVTKTYVIPYDRLLAHVRFSSNSTGSSLEAEIAEMANRWIGEGWTADYSDARITEW